MFWSLKPGRTVTYQPVQERKAAQAAKNLGDVVLANSSDNSRDSFQRPAPSVRPCPLTGPLSEAFSQRSVRVAPAGPRPAHAGGLHAQRERVQPFRRYPPAEPLVARAAVAKAQARIGRARQAARGRKTVADLRVEPAARLLAAAGVGAGKRLRRRVPQSPGLSLSAP